ncbi:MAG: arginine repressor [Oscillospiraceae bacterium]|jgi:transcriptional regulator of arginine metabolism|nr:arginine repressor [Oscillospiraceae bacterium]
MKVKRQTKLLELIADEDIETQEELSARLRDFGFNNTQATVSRDIKELRLIKVPAGSGRYRYALPAAEKENTLDSRLRTIFRESVLSFENAQNLVVIKTLPGLGMAAAAAVDAMSLPELMGSLAGDDTAFLAFGDAAKARDFCQRTKTMLEGG